MFDRLFFKQPVVLVALAVAAGMALVALRYLDQTIALAGLWFFMGLTLTTGFFHGALDIVLIQREFATAHRLAIVIALYAGSAVLLAFICAHNGWLLILVLLAMSVWHFGEPYGRWAHGYRDLLALAQRAIAGGAPVMLPALLSGHVLQDILPLAVGSDAGWSFALWRILAWLWVGVCGASLTIFRQRLFSKPLFAEVALIFAINLLLSPLMAFSIYFGVFHATAHILRVAAKYRQKEASEKQKGYFRGLDLSTGLAVALTSLATLLLLLLLIWYLNSAPASAGAQHSLLNWVLVALTAVTFPHLVLVSRNARWLTAP